MLDRYQFERELASDARGAVFCARDTRTGRAVAIKVTPAADAALCTHPDLSLRSSVQPRLIHRHIPCVRERGLDGHLSYVVTDMVAGRDLAAHTRAPRLLPLDVALDVVARVARALRHAHRRGIVHGDVKPGNIVFDPDTGALALVDFPLDEPGACATPAYASPERLCGGEASAASDQFALGVTLYQLCCGALPFSGRSRAEIAQRVVHEPHTDVRVYFASAPSELAGIIDKALAKDPTRRYGSIGGMGRAVAALLRARAS
jgi:serine/threonine protein kinase